MTAASPSCDSLDRALLVEAQKQVPIAHRPFALLGERLGLSEQDVLDRLGRLKAAGVLRHLSARFDLWALGYQGLLVAMQIDPARVDQAAEAVGGYPGITYSCRRDDPLNLWLTLAVAPQESLDRLIAVLRALAQADDVVTLQTLRWYKHHLPPEAPMGEMSLSPLSESTYVPLRLGAFWTLDTQDLRCFRICQEDLPLLEIPYAVWAEQAEMTEEALFAWMRRREQAGHFCGVAAWLAPRPERRSAYRLVAWSVADDAVDAVGARLARFSEVVACCRRQAHRRWPYALSTMLHAEEEAHCAAILQRIRGDVGALSSKLVGPITEYKAAPLKYFDPALEGWWESARAHGNILK